MSNNTKPFCFPPFLPEANFPNDAGSRAGRLCAPIGETSCCLPCPRQEWFYPAHFQTLINAATYFNLVSVAGCVFLIASYWVLPVTATHRHYLSVCLVISVLLMETAFVIPFGNSGQEHQCVNDITPHDQGSSIVCALSGASLLAGGWCVVLWVFLRALSLHLQICWQVIPGRHFFYGAMISGWMIPAGMVAVALSVTGVSFRFGDTCHINSKNGLASFWGPLLACAAAAIVTQFVTFGYCIQVYLRSLFEDRQATDISAYPTSVLSASYTQAMRRIRRVVSLQWRGILVVIIIVADVVFFATVFLQFEGTSETTPGMLELAQPWLQCIVGNGGDKEKCFDLAKPIVVPEATAVTVLFLLSCNGLWVLLLLGRWSMVTGWGEYFKSFFKPVRDNDEFVSYAATRPAQLGVSERTYSDLPSSTFDMSERKFRDDVTVESYEMGRQSTVSYPSAPPSIIQRDSLRSKKKRASNIRISFSSPFSPTIPTPVREEAVAGLGYNYPLSDSGAPRPGIKRAISNPIRQPDAVHTPPLQKSASQRTMIRTSTTTEMAALQMSMASSNRARLNPSPAPSSRYSPPPSMI